MNGSIKTWLRKQIKTALGNSRFLARLVSELLFLKLKLRGRLPRNNILEMIEVFVPEERRANAKYLNRLQRDMLFSCLYYRISNREYFLYNFEGRTDFERKQYVGVYELRNMYRQLNATGHPEFFDDKKRTFDVFREYFHRDVCLVDAASQKDTISRFLTDHSTCLLKPLKKYGGKGIERVELSSEAQIDHFLMSYSKKMPFLLEEMITQDHGMAKFHPQSVNTIRYTTFFYKGELSRLQAVVRIGMGGSYVDNATSGGIYSLVDTETGIIVTPARSDKGELYHKHPDTGVQILGNMIPHWKELNELLEQVVRVVPEQKQVGWDFALTPDGWVMVEGNTLPALQSFDLEHGLRDLVDRTLRRALLESGER